MYGTAKRLKWIAEGWSGTRLRSATVSHDRHSARVRCNCVQPLQGRIIVLCPKPAVGAYSANPQLMNGTAMRFLIPSPKRMKGADLLMSADKSPSKKCAPVLFAPYGSTKRTPCGRNKSAALIHLVVGLLKKTSPASSFFRYCQFHPVEIPVNPVNDTLESGPQPIIFPKAPSH